MYDKAHLIVHLKMAEDESPAMSVTSLSSSVSNPETDKLTGSTGFRGRLQPSAKVEVKMKLI